LLETLRTADGLDLQLYVWDSITGPLKATVAIVHGYGEHVARYAHVAQAMNARGIQVLGIDLRGHGKSSGRRGAVLKFRDYHQDIDALLEAARKRAKGSKLFILCHSMGGLATFDYLLHGGGKDVAGVVSSSPFFGVALAVPQIKLAVGRLLSRYLPSLAIASGIKGHHVTRDPVEAKKYETDPLNNSKANVRWYTEAMSTIDSVLSRVSEIQLPILLVYGGADQLASASVTDRFAAGLKAPDRSIEKVEGGAHELVNDVSETRTRIIGRMTDWVIEHA